MAKEILIGEQAEVVFHKRKMGRPPGKSHRQKLWDEHVKPHLPDLYLRGLEMARDGDSIMMKFFLDKGAPKNPIDTPLPVVNDALEQIVHIMQHVAQGQMSADDGVKLASIVKERINIDGMNKLTARLDSFEQWMKDRDQGVTINGDSPNGKELDS